MPRTIRGDQEKEELQKKKTILLESLSRLKRQQRGGQPLRQGSAKRINECSIENHRNTSEGPKRHGKRTHFCGGSKKKTSHVSLKRKNERKF